MITTNRAIMSLSKIRTLWNNHVDTPFPPRLRGEEIQDIDLVLLDSEVAGCVASYLSSSWKKNDTRKQVLEACQRELHEVLEVLEEEEHDYYNNLLKLTTAILEDLKP